jgi:hypothetical protein
MATSTENSDGANPSRGLLNCWEEDGAPPAAPTIPKAEKPSGAVPIQQEDGSFELAKPQRRHTSMFDFSNVEQIKQKVRATKLKKDPYNVHNCYHETGFFQAVARHTYFENCTLAIIVFNAIWISHDTDGNTAETLNKAKAYFIVADSLFFSYFTIELIIRFMAFKKKSDCMCDGWFVFDSALVFLYAFDPFVIAIIAEMSGGGGLDLPTAVLRLFRLARLSRLVRMLRSLPELMIMIKGMVSAAASVGYTLGLLIVITYVFAIALRNLVPTDSDVIDLYFSSVPEAMHNLIIYGTFLDNLADFVLGVKEDSSESRLNIAICLIMVWLYIALASLTVMNMLIGVLCEVISAVAEEEKESMMIDKVKEKFSSIVEELDRNKDGVLSWEEFKKILDIPEASRALESVGVDAISLVDVAEDFFFDEMGQHVSLTFEQFMEMVLDLRGGQEATVTHVMAMGKRFGAKFINVKGRIEGIESSLAILDQNLDRILKAS